MAEQPSLTRAHVLNVVLTYAAVASLWILLSDKAVEWLFSTPAQFALASTIKGGCSSSSPPPCSIPCCAGASTNRR